MITEPEMWGEPAPEPPTELLSGGDRPPPSGSSARRARWAWALGGVVAASVLWAAALQVTGYGHTRVPDLHGYHLMASPCTTANLEPLTETISENGFQAYPASVRKGPALDHVSCALTSTTRSGTGQDTTYVVSVTIELHKKTDPRAEFEATYNAPVATATPDTVGDAYLYAFTDAVSKPYPGLGDLAYVTGNRTHQQLSVLYGGAVVSLSVDGTNLWASGGGPLVIHPDGSSPVPEPADISGLRPVMDKTVRHLMSVLSR